MSYVSTDAHTDSHIIPNAHAHISVGDQNKVRKEQAKDKVRKFEDEGKDLWAVTKEKLFQPAVAGGLFSI
ncbi:hypothetical protein FRC18_008108, partial [Serendipita sp. 400]